MKLIEIKRMTSQKLCLVFEFKTDEIKRYIQISKYKDKFSFSYNNTLFGKFIIYYRRELAKKNIIKTHCKMTLKDFEYYINFLKKYKKYNIHRNNYYFSEHQKKEKNLNNEIKLIKELIKCLINKEEFIKQYEREI